MEINSSHVEILTKLEDWDIFTEKFLQQKKYPLILLSGNLGSGKTTFTQFLTKKLGVEDEVSSPTYALVNEYASQEDVIYHFDLYRLKSAEEAEDMGMDEYLSSGNLCIIEWPEVYMEELKHYPHHHIIIESLEQGRKVLWK